MKKAWFFVILALAASLSLSAQTVSSEKVNPSTATNILDRIFDPDSVVFGKTFSEWDSEWQQWAYSIPVENHPLFDNGDCSVGQSGMVWFLGGKFCGNNEPGCSYTGVQRSCTVPRGKYLYIPVDNGEDSALEESVVENPGDINAQQIGFMRQLDDPWTHAAPIESAIIDGVKVPNLQKYAVQSTVFGFTMPENNYLKAVYPTAYSDSFKAGTYFPAVDNGRYLMLAPLPPGMHTIKIAAYFPVWDFGFDVTYSITVPR